MTIVRPRTILGHGRLGIMAILFEFVADGAPVFVFGGGDNRYQFVHADDLADACLLAADRPGPSSYNIGAPSFGTMRETLQALVDHAGTGSRVRSLPSAPARLGMKALTTLGQAPFAPYHWLLYGESLWFDTTKARTELGWEPKHSNADDGDRVLRVVPRPPRLARPRRRLPPPVPGPPRPPQAPEAPPMTTTEVPPNPEVATDGQQIRRRSVATSRGAWGWWVGLTGLVVLPLVVGLVAARSPRWYPVLDLAQTELRVRDVGGRHTPLVGLPGRIGSAARQGSHPGPLSFYALAPVYRLLGSSAWALQAAAVAVHAVAIGAALWIARRRAGTPLMAALAVALALLAAGYGTTTLAVPWNPYLPLLWWVVVLLATWSVLCGDVALLPVVVLAGSFCAQTHVPYVGLCGAAGALALAAAIKHRGPDARRWIVVAAAVGAVAWAPPVMDQFVHEPGNLGILADHFLSPPDDETVGIGTGARLLTQRVDGEHLVVDSAAEPGVLVSSGSGGRRARDWRGVATIAVWGAAAVAAWRWRHRALVRLHVVIAAALAVGTVVVARIFGTVWYYLMIWAWGIAALMLVAVAWTAATRLPKRHRNTAVAVAVAVTALVSVRFSLAAVDEEQPDAVLSAQLGRLLPDTDAALDDGETYLVTWTDAAHIGSQGYGLVNELERRGFDVGVLSGLGATTTFHRVLDPSQADARVNLATGVWVERWRDVPGAEEVATDDPRTPAERREFERLRDEVIAELEAAGLDELVSRVDDSLFGLTLDERISDSVRDKLGEMLRIGVPVAVFVAPPDAEADAE